MTRASIQKIAALLFVLHLAPLALYAQNRTAAALFDNGAAFMLQEQWYDAAAAFLEALRINPSHAQAAGALAECYYFLGEFDQALSWVQHARALARGNQELANLEARIHIALGRLNEAAVILGEVLTREPFNLSALFAQAELDVARGRLSEAVLRYREALRRHPDDQRLLISLALVLGSMGQHDEAGAHINRVLAGRSEDPRAHYYAAYLAYRAGRLNDGIRHAERALFFRNNFESARSLLAKLRFRSGQYEEAERLANELISRNRGDTGAWYLRGMALWRLGRHQQAIAVLSAAAGINPDNEFIRVALTELLITETALEDPVRQRWADWHFARARDFTARRLNEQALFEYRRALRLNPFAPQRQEYADILRLQGFPARFLEQLVFMQSLGMEDQTIDALVMLHTARLAPALFRRWDVEPVQISRRHWNVAVFSVDGQSSYLHVDAGALAAAYVRDLLAHNRSIQPLNLEVRQSSFAAAFRTAREAGADYFLILEVTESERDISLRGQLFVARTGSPAGTFASFRTGGDRLRNAGRHLIEQLDGALTFRGELTARRASQGLINKGRADGVSGGALYTIVRRGTVTTRNDGIGLAFAADDVVGTITITEADEEVSAGTLSRNGFHDRIEPGDEVILHIQPLPAAPAQGAADPELRAMLRTLR